MDNDRTDPRPRYTVLGLFAGAGVGLLTGALAFALLLPPPTNTFALASTYALTGLGPLTAGTLIVGLATLGFIRRRYVGSFATGILVFALSLGLAILVAAIATAFGINFFLAVLGFGIPIIWCMTVAVMLLPWLSRHRTISVAALAAVAAMSIFGLVNLT